MIDTPRILIEIFKFSFKLHMVKEDLIKLHYRPFACKVTILFYHIFQMSNMAMTDAEIVQLFAKIHQQEHENEALEKMQHLRKCSMGYKWGWRKMRNALLGS